ncbi:hypothetical protein KCMC57_63930 (plasmid) [Kitasatospora sp. CMC57]|uniref:Uncharacterized protein n=1 Tax=Kitasatospora sp. CMC57 TaxID=3231513 RepID=A0AB33KB54_9ACTN
MTADTPIPLASSADMQSGAFADLVRAYQPDYLDTVMLEATRLCEDYCERRLAPFTNLPETHRAQGIDPDELTGITGMPMSLQGTLGTSYANALSGSGAGTMVRHVWLNEFAPRYPDLWTYSDLSVQIVLSQGGLTSLPGTQLIGAEPDSGHVWFQLGTLLPPGSLIRCLYSGGYTTVPASLSRGAKYMAASIIATEIDPMRRGEGHDPDALRAQAEEVLAPYART